MNSSVSVINDSCSNRFRTECSDADVLGKSSVMQVENGKCVLEPQNTSIALSQQAVHHSYVGSSEHEELASSGKENVNASEHSALKSTGKENSVYGSENIPNTVTSNSICSSNDGSDGVSSHDAYDKNSWILYGDSQISAKNSWVLYGNSQSPPIEKSVDGIDLMQNDNVLLANAETRVHTFDGSLTDRVSEEMTKDKESAFEDVFNESRPHACSVCSKRFKLSHHLKEHMRIHTGEKPFPCSICGEKFSRSHLLRAHQARHAQESFPQVGTIFPCSKCMKIFESPQHLARHEKNHVQLKIHKCTVCNKQFTHQILLNRHTLQHFTRNCNNVEKRPDVMIKQEQNDKDLADSDLPMEKTEQGKKINLSSSSEQVITNENKPQVSNVLSDEQNIKTTENKPPISYGKSTVYDQKSWSVYGHKFNAETETRKEESQMDHSESVENAASVYKGIDMAKLHELYLATNRSLYNRNGLLLPFYGMFGFNRHTLMSLIDHSGLNSGALPVSYIGGQDFKNDSSPAGGSRPHQCPHCSKRFKLSHHLREHLRIHTGEKPYHCDLCHERFSRSHLLQRHKTKHISDYAFHQVTDWIEKTSTNSSDYNEMSDHISMSYHHGETKIENIKDVSMDKPATVISNSLNSIENHSSHSINHKKEDDGGKLTTSSSESEEVLKLDNEKNPCKHIEETPSGSEATLSNQNINCRGDKAILNSSGINSTSDFNISGKGCTSDSNDTVSSKDHKSDMIVGISGTFQTSRISENNHRSTTSAAPRYGSNTDTTENVLEMDHESEFVLGNEDSASKSDSFPGSMKRNLGSNSVVRFPESVFSESSDPVLGMDYQPDSMAIAGLLSTNKYPDKQQNHSEDKPHMSVSDQCISKQTGEFHNHKIQDKDEQDTEMFDVVKSVSEENLENKIVKSETILPVTKQSASHCISNFQMNQSLLNNNINLLNKGYLNLTPNVQQAISSGMFRSHHDGDSVPFDIPHGDLLHDAFLSPLEYSNFFRSRHGGFLRCEFCGKLFADMNNLRQHLVSHSMNRHFSCHLCEKKFKRPHHLKEHMRIHTGEKPYVCDICDEKFSRSHILQRHRMKHGTTLLNDSYVQNILNICEQNRRTGSPEFVYDKFCSQDVIKSDSAVIPASSDSDSDTKSIPTATPSVNESDVVDSNFRNVRKWHSFDTKGFCLQNCVCRECGKRFANSSNLKQHMVSHFPDRLFPCSVCDKKFKRPHHLKEHSRTHTGEKPYECSRCGDKFQRSHLLMKHKEKHHSQYGYSMDISVQPTASVTKLNGYLDDSKHNQNDIALLPDEDAKLLGYKDTPKTVTGDSDQSGGESVLCNICNKEFPSEMLLTVHKRTHPGDRPHQCANCGKHFALQYLLEVHEKSCS